MWYNVSVNESRGQRGPGTRIERERKMRKYQELVNENSDFIAKLKDLRKERAEVGSRMSDLNARGHVLADMGRMARAFDLFEESEELEQRSHELFATIQEFESDLNVMLYGAYENVPERTRRQGFAGFYRESGL